MAWAETLTSPLLTSSSVEGIAGPWVELFALVSKLPGSSAKCSVGRSKVGMVELLGACELSSGVSPVCCWRSNMVEGRLFMCSE